jgi:predicted HAD superfamily Cof-like phosphohydrolase
MKKIDSLSQVAEFHKIFFLPIEDHPTIPSAERCELRVSLIREELQELEEAIEKHDMVGIADALCDIQYVLSGAVLEFGLGRKFSALFDEVQRSNMSKACKTEDEAKATVVYYREKENIESYYRKLNGKYMVYRAGDHKTLKSIKYSPANLRPILENIAE